jgi:anti-sigma factor RsiW
MTPAEARERIPQYLDGELSPGERALVESALAESPELRSELERWKTFNACLCRCCNTDVAPAGLRERVRASLERESRATLRFGRRLRIGAFTALAAAVALFFWLRPELIDSTWRSASSSGTSSAALLIAPEQLESVWHHCSKDGHCKRRLAAATLAAARDALRQQLGLEAETPDLTAQGFEFSGCCPCFPGAGAAAQVFYRDPASGRALSLFSIPRAVELQSGRCGPDDCRAIAGYQESESDGVSMIRWTGPHGAYLMVADVPLGDLRRIARQLAASHP